MFLENKYHRWYRNIITQAKHRVNCSDKIIEKHHILPTSLGGLNIDENKVALTPREHFICHLLLSRFTTGNAKYKMTVAINLMIKNTSKLLNRERVTSRKYNMKVMFSRVSFSKEHREKLSIKAKINRPKQKFSAESNEKRRQSMIGKNVGKVHTDETKQKISLSKRGVKLGPHSEDTKAKISAALTGKIISDETKQKMSKGHLGKKIGPQTEEHKRKISESTKGKKKNSIFSKEERERRSVAMKKLRAKQKLNDEFILIDI